MTSLLETLYCHPWIRHPIKKRVKLRYVNGNPKVKCEYPVGENVNLLWWTLHRLPYFLLTTYQVCCLKKKGSPMLKIINSSAVTQGWFRFGCSGPLPWRWPWCFDTLVTVVRSERILLKSVTWSCEHSSVYVKWVVSVSPPRRTQEPSDWGWGHIGPPPCVTVYIIRGRNSKLYTGCHKTWTNPG